MALDKFLQSVPKLPFINVTADTIPPYGIITLWQMDRYGNFQAYYGGEKHDDAAQHEVESAVHHEPDTVEQYAYPHAWSAPNVDTKFNNLGTSKEVVSYVPTEWATAFNLGNAVEPGKVGQCYTHLPAIVALADPDYEPSYGEMMTLYYGGVGSQYNFKLGVAGVNRLTISAIRNGWPFICKIPNRDDLGVIGGINSFEHSGNISY